MILTSFGQQSENRKQMLKVMLQNIFISHMQQLIHRYRVIPAARLSWRFRILRSVLEEGVTFMAFKINKLTYQAPLGIAANELQKRTQYYVQCLSLQFATLKLHPLWCNLFDGNMTQKLIIYNTLVSISGRIQFILRWSCQNWTQRHL